jgi:hypothetical protein
VCLRSVFAGQRARLGIAAVSIMAWRPQRALPNFSRKCVAVHPQLPGRYAYVASIHGNRLAQKGRFKLIHSNVEGYPLDDQFGDELLHLFSHFFAPAEIARYHYWGDK